MTAAMIHANGYWIGARNLEHYYDRPLAAALVDFFGRGVSVADLGCGSGDYVRRLRAESIQCDGWDGNPNTPLFNADCRVLDLSRPVELGKVYDWVLSLEVAEHLPPEFEAAFLDNVHRHNRLGVVLSWAIPGQGGMGHFNERPNDYVQDRMRDLGYSRDRAAETTLRTAASFWWFHHTLMVYRRPEAPRQHNDDSISISSE
jgi:SAM-dependent methyltransferase